MFTWGVIRGVRTPVCYALSLQNKWKSFTTCRSSVYRVGKTLSFYSQKAINWDLDFAFKNFKFILHFCIYCILYVVYSMFWHAQCTPVQLLYILSLTPWNLDLDAFPVSFFIRHSFSKRRFEPCLHHIDKNWVLSLCNFVHDISRGISQLSHIGISANQKTSTMSAVLKLAVLLFCLLASCMSFSPSFRPATSLVLSSKIGRSQPLYAKKKVVAPLVDANGKEFWQGDWVCAGEDLLIVADQRLPTRWWKF